MASCNPVRKIRFMCRTDFSSDPLPDNLIARDATKLENEEASLGAWDQLGVVNLSGEGRQ